MMAAHEYVTIREALEILDSRGQRVADSRVRQMALAGKIRGAKKIGRDWWVPRVWAEKFKRYQRE